MKKILHFLFLITFISQAFSQNPVIDGDTMLCPYEDGTVSITNNQSYDSYQWYYKLWFLNDDYQAIDGATTDSFTYDWENYDQSLFKVVVTLNGNTYESNSIQIDSYQWSALYVSFNFGENVTYDPVSESIVLCQGASYEIAINNPPYDNIIWYRNGFPIDGATEATYTVTQEGAYEVRAAPSFCPNAINYSAVFNTVIDNNCTLGIDELEQNIITNIFPNPVIDQVNFTLSSNIVKQYEIYDFSGKVLITGDIKHLNNSISVAKLSPGIYFLRLIGDNIGITRKFIKQ